MRVKFKAGLKMKALLFLLSLLVARAVCQFGCQLSLSNCTSNGLCRPDGVCNCFQGFIGENCEIKTSFVFKSGGIGKNDIAFWVLFWVLVNFLVPYILYLGVLSIRKERGKSQLAEHCRDVGEACCCIPNPSNKEPPKPKTARDYLSKDKEQLITPRVDEEAGNNQQQMIAQSELVPESRPETAAERQKRSRLLKSAARDNRRGLAESLQPIMGESRLAHAESFLMAQEEGMKRLRIAQRSSALETLRQVYPYDTFEQDDAEELNALIVEEEEALGLSNPPKYSELISQMYK